jgi:hypothetical protein
MPLLAESLLKNIATRIATTALGGSTVSAVKVTQITDSVGDAALRFRIVLRPTSTTSIGGDAALNNLVRLKQALEREGEERFPIMTYATEDELAGGSD